MKNNIALIGFMGTGKSSVGKLLAEKMNLTFVDTDKLIEQKEGKSISDIFAENGESYFRNLESIVIKEVTQEKRQVIATGGGSTTVDENYLLLNKNAHIICLQASPENILTRIEKDKNRPLLNEIDRLQKIKTLLAKRAECYNKADYSLMTDECCLDEVVSKIMDYLKQENVQL